MSLLHPLASPSVQLFNCHDQASIDFDDLQPVLLDGDIYMKGKCTLDGRNLRLWKYSIESKTFSESMFPETCRNVTKDDRHLLTSLGSQLLLVHAQFTYPDPLPEPIYIEGKIDYELTYHEYIDPEDLAESDVRQRTHLLKLYLYKHLRDNEWDRSDWHTLYILKCPDPLPIVDPLYALDGHYSDAHYYHKSDENRARDPMYWDVSAASTDDHLLVAFFRRDKYDQDEYDSITEYGYGPFINTKIMIFSLLNKYIRIKQCIEGPQFWGDYEDCKITKPFIFICDDDVFVKVWTKGEDKAKNLKKVSLKSLLNDKYPKWCDSHSIPESVLTYSNFTLLDNQPVIAMNHNAKLNNSSLYLCALTSCNSSDTWVELARFNCHFDPAPVVMGLSDGSKFVAIGMLKIDSQLDINRELHVLQVNPEVAVYHPESNFTLAAINKIQVGAGISLLSTLEVSLSKLQKLAGFDLSGSHDPFYSTNSMIPKYFCKWTNGNSLHGPTWRNFFTILKEMKEVAIAEKIEKYLTESTAHVVQNDDSEEPTQFNATGSEEVADLKHQLDSLYQELGGVKSDTATVQGSIGSIRGKVKLCIDRSQVALNKIEIERQDLLDRIEELKRENKEINEELAVLKLDFQGPPAKCLCIETVITESNVSTATTMSTQIETKPSGLSSTMPPDLSLESEVLDQAKISSQHLPGLMKKLKQHAAKWREIGTYLGFLPGELTNIEARPNLTPGAPTSWLGAMLEEWIQWAPDDNRGSTSFASLQDLKDALRDAGLGATAHEVK